MLAIIAAVLFGLALLLDLTGVSLGGTITPSILVTAGLLCMALQLAGIGTKGRSWNWRRARR